LIQEVKDADFYRYIGAKRVLILESNNDEPRFRIELLEEIIKEREEREEREECERNRMGIVKRDVEFADGSSLEKFGTNKIQEFSKMMRQSRLQTECNILLHNAVETNGFPWTKKLEIPVAFVWPEMVIQRFSWDVIEDDKVYPVYFFITLHAQNYMNWLKIIDSCGLVSDDVYVKVRTYKLYPKNDCALETCRRIVGDCSLLDKL